jgi:mannose-1-phosphate guanylyltransferase
MEKENTYCVIMAGGIGSRFWPLSRTSMPKQFLDILGVGKTFIRQTYERFSKIVPPKNFYVVTSVDYKGLVLNQLPELKEEQVLLEPLRRNTAPCIAYAMYKIQTVCPDANVIVAPSDHIILKEEEFIKQISAGIEFVESNNALLTLGVKPSRPETGYGYIQISKKKENLSPENLFKVKTFTEKPDLKMAEIFLASGEFFWNSGIFLWSMKSIMDAFNIFLNDISTLFSKGIKLYNTENESAFINKVYSECQGISIDYGLMEKAKNVYVLTADFGWSDLGTWGSLYENKGKDENGNVVFGENLFAYNTKNCIVNIPEEKTVVLQGLDGYIVVESNNTILVCRKEDEQHIRQFVMDVKLKKGDSFV